MAADGAGCVFLNFGKNSWTY